MAQDIWERKYWLGRLSLLLLWLRAPRGEMFAVIWDLCIYSFIFMQSTQLYVHQTLLGRRPVLGLGRG